MGGLSLARGFRCLERERESGNAQGRNHERYKAYGLTTIIGCVMMGMGERAADTETKPE